jgi:tetratricopeptide (TPR) repeat protein
LYLKVHQNPEILAHNGIAYYKLKNYDIAIDLLKKAYKIVENSPYKEDISYDIAAVYAVKNDIKNVKVWLKMPLMENSTYYKSEIEKEKDFDILRHDSEFIEFLLEFGDKNKSMKKN